MLGGVISLTREVSSSHLFVNEFQCFDRWSVSYKICSCANGEFAELGEEWNERATSTRYASRSRGVASRLYVNISTPLE